MSNMASSPSKPKARHPLLWGLAAVGLGAFGLLVLVAAIAVWAWNGHRVGGSGQPTTTKVVVPELPSPTPAGTGVDDLLKQAAGLRAQNRLREAEIILTRAIQTDGKDIRVLRAIAAVQRGMSGASLKAGNLLSSAQEVDRAKISVITLQGVAIDPGSSSMDPKILIDEEKANASVESAVREAIDSECQQAIYKADCCRYEAYHSLWKNDRGKVVEGLQHLKKVYEFGLWASERTRMSTNAVFSKLRNLVDKEEWNGLLAQAGFDPGSRETVKKWGLE